MQLFPFFRGWKNTYVTEHFFIGCFYFHRFGITKHAKFRSRVGVMTSIRSNGTLEIFQILQMETEKVNVLWKCGSFKCQRQIQEPCCIEDGAICDKN